LALDSIEERSDVDVLHRAVGERQPQPVTFKGLHIADLDGLVQVGLVLSRFRKSLIALTIARGAP
jgi:hypothetical protein